MDLLSKIIRPFSIKHGTSFRKFHIGLGKSESELKLYDWLVGGKHSSLEIQLMFYPNGNKHAYEKIRKGLMQSMVDYIGYKAFTDEHSPRKSLFTLNFCLDMMLAEEYDVVTHFMKKTESQAVKDFQLEILDTLYKFQLDHVKYFDIDVEELQKKKRSNKRKLKARDDKREALALVNLKLEQAKKVVDIQDPAIIIDGVLNELKFTKEELLNPDLIFNLIATYRNAIASTNGYVLLEPYVKMHYDRLLAANAFGKGQKDAHLGFIYILAHTDFREYKFQEGLQKLSEMPGILPISKFKKSKYYPKYVALNTAIAYCTGHNTEAIRDLKSILNSNLPDIRDRANMELNYAVGLAGADDHKGAIEVLLEMAKMDAVYKVKMGPKFMFTKNLIMLLTYYDLGKKETALALLKQLRHDFSKFLRKPEYERVRKFLKIILRMCNGTVDVKSIAFRKSLGKTGLASSATDDIQIVGIFSWLKAKMTGRKHYTVFVERVNETMQMVKGD